MNGPMFAAEVKKRVKYIFPSVSFIASKTKILSKSNFTLQILKFIIYSTKRNIYLINFNKSQESLGN